MRYAIVTFFLAAALAKIQDVTSLLDPRYLNLLGHPRILYDTKTQTVMLTNVTHEESLDAVVRGYILEHTNAEAAQTDRSGKEDWLVVALPEDEDVEFRVYDTEFDLLVELD